MNRPKTITQEQARQLDYHLENRCKVIFELSVETGMRISDILALRIKDLTNPMTIYERKSKRNRTFTLTPKLYANLEFLCDFKTKSDFIFESHTRRGTSLHRSTYHRQIKKALKWCDFDASAHSARKLYAKTIYEQTGSVEAVKNALHHRKLSTTLTYLDLLSNEQLKALEAQENATEQSKTNIFSRIKNFVNKIIDKINHYKR